MILLKSWLRLRSPPSSAIKELISPPLLAKDLHNTEIAPEPSHCEALNVTAGCHLKRVQSLCVAKLHPGTKALFGACNLNFNSIKSSNYGTGFIYRVRGGVSTYDISHISATDRAVVLLPRLDALCPR